VFSDSERDSFRLRVPSISQDLVPGRSGLLTLSIAQSFSTHSPHFYRHEKAREDNSEVRCFPSYLVASSKPRSKIFINNRLGASSVFVLRSQGLGRMPDALWASSLGQNLLGLGAGRRRRYFCRNQDLQQSGCIANASGNRAGLANESIPNRRLRKSSQ